MSSASNHDIAIIAANYNYGDYLDDFFRSLLKSSVQPAQVIIVDDGSSDRSREILNSYQSLESSDFIFLPANTGFANALNTAISRIRCPFAMRADTDDRIHPLKIEKQLNFLLENPEISGVGCNVIYFDGITNQKKFCSRFPLNPEEIRNCYKKGEHGLQHPTVMLRSMVLQNYRYSQEAFPAEDYQLFATMTAEGHKFANLPDELYEMRIHNRSITTNINFQTIEKTYSYRDKIFATRTPQIRKWLYYFHILNYRRALSADRRITKWFFLSASLLFMPGKIVKRFR